MIIVCATKILKNHTADFVLQFDANDELTLIPRDDFSQYIDRWCLFVYKPSNPEVLNQTVNQTLENTRENISQGKYKNVAFIKLEDLNQIALRLLPKEKFAYRVTSRGILIALKNDDLDDIVKIKEWLNFEGLECDLVRDYGRLRDSYNNSYADPTTLNIIDNMVSLIPYAKDKSSSKKISMQDLFRLKFKKTFSDFHSFSNFINPMLFCFCFTRYFDSISQTSFTKSAKMSIILSICNFYAYTAFSS